MTELKYLSTTWIFSHMRGRVILNIHIPYSYSLILSLDQMSEVTEVLVIGREENNREVLVDMRQGQEKDSPTLDEQGHYIVTSSMGLDILRVIGNHSLIKRRECEAGGYSNLFS